MACGPTANTADVPKELERYQDFLMRAQSDSIAAMFASDGVIANPGAPEIVGPAAIATQLKGFADYKLLGDSMVVDSMQSAHVVATQFGHYWQRVRIPKGDTVEVRGKFQAEWVWTPQAGWKIRRMGTHP